MQCGLNQSSEFLDLENLGGPTPTPMNIQGNEKVASDSQILLSIVLNPKTVEGFYGQD